MRYALEESRNNHHRLHGRILVGIGILFGLVWLLLLALERGSMRFKWEQRDRHRDRARDREKGFRFLVTRRPWGLWPIARPNNAVDNLEGRRDHVSSPHYNLALLSQQSSSSEELHLTTLPVLPSASAIVQRTNSLLWFSLKSCVAALMVG